MSWGIYFQQKKECKINSSALNFLSVQLSNVPSDISPKLDLSIEGMRSQQFSEWIFVFLLIGILVFSGIVVALLKTKIQTKDVRPGEKMMFAAIIGGLIIAVLFGAVQMLGGYLF